MANNVETEALSLRNPNKNWVIKELETLIAEWEAWHRVVAAIKDHPYDRQTQGGTLADGEDNLEKRRTLQAKTLTF